MCRGRATTPAPVQSASPFPPRGSRAQNPWSTAVAVISRAIAAAVRIAPRRTAHTHRRGGSVRSCIHILYTYVYIPALTQSPVAKTTTENSSFFFFNFFKIFRFLSARYSSPPPVTRFSALAESNFEIFHPARVTRENVSETFLNGSAALRRRRRHRRRQSVGV